MARAATLGNGNILVGLDQFGLVRDFYFPHVGLTNHISGASGNHVHRIGVYVDDTLSWLSDSAWTISCVNPADSGIGSLHAVNESLGIEINSTDAVHNEENVFIRSLRVKNTAGRKRKIKIFFAQQFRIDESRRGDTGLYDPRVNALIHYKGNTTFLINAHCEGVPFSEYNIGLFGIEGKEGTYMDAGDGKLEKNPIEHGSVDSIIALEKEVAKDMEVVFEYWIAVADSIDNVHKLNRYIIDETPNRLIDTTKDYWQAWLSKDGNDMSMFSRNITDLYHRSLYIMRTHADNRGGIIASSDTDMLHHGRDTYSYVWPRDGAIIAHAFDVSGYTDTAKRFYSFMTNLIEPGGYLMHKYCTDGALGSSWHSWMQEGKPEFPIQEDETALLVYMLYQHYSIRKDLEFIESLYNPFIEPAAEFMVQFIESRYGLPQNSFDLWEEKFGISTYTASAVYGALTAAATFANILGKEEPARTYNAVAQRMQKAILEHLYNDELGMFVKLIRARDDDNDTVDSTLDMSSFFGPWYFGVVDIDDPRIQKAFNTVIKKLEVADGSEGFVRYEGDAYYKMQDANSPNPWVVTTLWVAQYHIKKAQTLDELKPAYQLLEWTTTHATSAGVLSEQMHPHTREHLSTAPLVWSHAEYVLTCNAYRVKYAELTARTE